MCGIVGYIGPKPAIDFLIDGLKKLEYRGYDSAGVAVLEEGETEILKSAGKLSVLQSKLDGSLKNAVVGIGHTRWATHGRPSDANAHPHSDCTGRFSVVHNGIIENYMALKEWLREEGHEFASETDSEVIAHLVEHFYEGDLEKAVLKVLKKIRGSYALAILSEDEPDKIIGVRQDSPLIVGLGRNENYLASDIPAILNYTRDIYVLNDGEIAVLSRDGVRVIDRDGQRVPKEVMQVAWDAVAAEKGGYEHFMLKEIHEQPRALRDTMSGRISDDNSRVILDEVRLTPEEIQGLRKIAIVACGTAYHAGLVGKHLIEKMARIPVEVDLASEFRYRDPIVPEGALLLAISQSGETADTLAAMREGMRRGARAVAISNVVGSTIAREADDVIYTWAGPEIAVASTKAYTTQLVALSLFAAYLAQARGTMSPEEIREFLAEMRELPAKAGEVLRDEKKVAAMAREFAKSEDVFFIGRGLDYAVAMEGSLKLKEISYIHAEAYAAGELKHGTLALIVKGIPVIALATQEALEEKMVSNMTEVKARDATVFGIALEGNEEIGKHADHLLRIPRMHPYLTASLAVLPLQMLAYHAAVARGCDVDKPRNLAKSVTVE